MIHNENRKNSKGIRFKWVPFLRLNVGDPFSTIKLERAIHLISLLKQN